LELTKTPGVGEPKPNAYLRTDDLAIGLGDRTARGGIVTLSSQAIKFVLGIVSTVVLARLLTPADYGLVGMVAVITGFVAIFKDLGLSSATIQKADLTESQITMLFWVNVAASAAIMLLTAAIAPLVARFYHEPRLTLITVGYASGFLLGGLSVQHAALLNRRMRFAALAYIDIMSLVAGIVVAIVLASRGAKYWALVASQLTQGLAYTIGVWYVCRWRPGRPHRNSDVTSMLMFGRNLTGFSIINYFARNLDNLLIGRFWGTVELGLYTRAYQLLMLPIDQINSPITAVAVPALSRLTDSPERYRSAYLRLIEKIALLTMPLMAFMIVCSQWVIQLLLGPSWAGVTGIFQLLAIAGFAQPICSTSGWLFITQGRSRDMLRWGMVGPPIIIVSILVGLPWGATGVALSYSVTFMCIITPALFWFVGRSGPVGARHVFGAVIPMLIASGAGLATAATVRWFIAGVGPLLGILICGAVSLSTTLLVLLVIPAGRRALADLVESLVPLLRSPRRLFE
jgi:O-antigen/teichoic acid export membrane protein